MVGAGRQEVKKPRWKDLADGPEHERIAIIGAQAEAGNVVGFFVDDDAKADRYIKKILNQFPSLEVMGRWFGPAGSVLVKVRKKAVDDAIH